MHGDPTVRPLYERYADNAPGPFYVIKGQCIICALPPETAPQSIKWSEETFRFNDCMECPTHCRVERQPETEEEIAAVIGAACGSCVEAIRYCGTDAMILAKFKELGYERLCDASAREPTGLASNADGDKKMGPTAVSQKGRAYAIAGLWLQAGPIFGVLGTVVGMAKVHSTLSSGVASPDQLSADISLALWTTAVGIVLGLAGVVCLLIALFGFRFRAPWFFWCLIVVSILQMTPWPIGTVIGMALLIYLILCRDEFLYNERPN